MLLGVIADDLTGASDIALMLSRAGLHTVQLIGQPPEDLRIDADAVVIGLKTRTCPPEQAVRESLAAAEVLVTRGARQLIFKYCSTFDSTDDGNIGPVIDALMDRLGVHQVLACPSFPENGRTVYQGHLFVGSRLLSDSPMKDHPLTPMRDANLVRVLARQTARDVSLIPRQTVSQGPDAISAALEEGAGGTSRIVIIDAIDGADLRSIASACRGMKLVTGGSAIGGSLAENFLNEGSGIGRPALFGKPAGPKAIIAGSCSVATRRQIQYAIGAGYPAKLIAAIDIAEGRMTVDDAVTWVCGAQRAVPLLYTSTDPDEVLKVQDRFGRESIGTMVETFLADVASELHRRGCRQLIVAGGETSGAVVSALGMRALEIGPEIDPGVPWTRSIGPDETFLALKSGNFGADDFFVKAWDILQ